MDAEHTNSELIPAPPQRRTLTAFDLSLVWFGAAIAIGEIWAGGLPSLTALGLAGGLLAIVFGRVVGNGLMAAMAHIGAVTGLPTMVLTRPAFGIRGSFMPAFFNVVQLVGWTGWMLFIGAAYMDILAAALGLPTIEALPQMRYLWVILLGTLCTVWALLFVRQSWWKLIERGSALALFVLTLAVSGLVLSRFGLSTNASASFSPLQILGGMDLVIAMSVSWLPLVADYSRYAVSPRAGAGGTFWGYFVGGTWMYAVGLLVALATGSATADQEVVSLLAGQGSLALAWTIAGVLLVLLSTATTTFLDIYSAVVSARSIWPRLPERGGNIAVGLIGIVIAIALDTSAYEPYLLAIGAIFLPIFTVVLVDYFLLSRRGNSAGVDVEAIDRRSGRYWYSGGLNWRAIVAWLVGFLVYDWARGFPALLTLYGGISRLTGAAIVNPPMQALQWGASLPCIAASAVAYLLLVAVFGNGRRAAATALSGRRSPS